MPSAFAPPEWFCGGFPVDWPGQREITTCRLIELLHKLASRTTEQDLTPLHRALHPAHTILAMQRQDGLWPARIDLRTGSPKGMGATDAPVSLLERLAGLLCTTEFDAAIARARK